MLINLHGHPKRPFDVGNRAAYIQHQAIGSRMSHRKPFDLAKSATASYPPRWPESFREFLHRQEMAVIGTRWVVKIVQ